MDEPNNPLPAAEPPPRRANPLARTLIGASIAVAVLVVVAVAVYAALNNNRPASTQTGTQPNDAAQQFFTERNNGTPVVFTDTMSYGGPVGGGRFPGVVGTVEKVDGTTFTVKNPIDNTTSTVQAGPETKVRKQEQVKVADLKLGSTLHAIGQKKDGVLAADLVQVGGDDGAPGGTDTGGPLGSSPMQIQINPGPGGATGPGGSTDGSTMVMPDQVTGTLEKVDGTTLTLKTADGSATVQLSSTTTINQQVTADLATIAVGDSILAQGTQNGAVFAATTIDINFGGMTMIRKP